MSTVTTHTKVLALRLALTFIASLVASRADVIQPTVELPPISGAYDFGGICLAAINRCTETAFVSGFDVLKRTTDSNGVVDVDATYSATIFADDAGVPGAFLGHLTMPGTVEFTYVGRNTSVNPLGTFTIELTAFDFSGMLGGAAFEVKKDPSNASSGDTTIVVANVGPPVTYDVSGSADIFALYITSAPASTANLIPSPAVVPEPGLGLLAGALLAGMAGIASRRRRRVR